MSAVTPCRCGFVGRDDGGLVDPYAGASAACWAAFGRLSARGTAQLAVDAYMAQHPGLATAGGVRSVWSHLVGLWLVFERGEPGLSTQVLGFVFPDKSAAPPDVGPVPPLAGMHVGTVLDATAARGDDETLRWARFVWTAWQPLHARVRSLGEAALTRSHAPRRR